MGRSKRAGAGGSRYTNCWRMGPWEAVWNTLGV